MVDTAPPVIALNGGNPLSVECGAIFVDPGATADDDCEGDVPVQVSLLSGPAEEKGVGGLVDTSAPGTFVLAYDAEDSQGNAAAQVTRVVNVVDTIPPVITLNGGTSVTVECGTAVYRCGRDCGRYVRQRRSGYGRRRHRRHERNGHIHRYV